MACGERAHEPDAGEREDAQQDRAGAPAQRGRRRVPGAEEADRKSGQRQGDEHRGEQRSELVSRAVTRCQRDIVGAQGVLGEVPCDDDCGPGGAGEQHRSTAQAQRHEAEPDHRPQQQCHERE